MTSLLISLLSYVIFVGIHVILHRYLVRIDKKTFASVLVFFIGLLIHAGISFLFLPLPWTSITLYGLLSWLHIVIFTESYYGDMGPSRQILAALKEKKAMTYQEIVNLFSDHVLIEKRIHNLQHDGLVTGDKSRLQATGRGLKLHRLLESYRALLQWKSSG